MIDKENKVYNKGQIKWNLIKWIKSYIIKRRVEKYLYKYLSNEDKEWLTKWHSENIFKKTGQVKDWSQPVYTWIHGRIKL